MKFKVLMGVVAIVFGLGGCTSMKYNAGTKSQTFDEPPVGQTTTVYVGEQMLRKGVIHEEGVLVVHAPVDGFAYQIPPGQYLQVGKDSKYTYHMATGVTKNPFADPIRGLVYGRERNAELCVLTPFGATACYAGDYSRETRTRVGKESFQQTLLYSGRIGDRISLSYREFKNDMARAAFTHDVEYDLATSTQIGYRGAVIEVLEADNDSITYRLLKNFR